MNIVPKFRLQNGEKVRNNRLSALFKKVHASGEKIKTLLLCIGDFRSIQIILTSALMIPFKLSFSAFTLQHSKATTLTCSQQTQCQSQIEGKKKKRRKERKMKSAVQYVSKNKFLTGN